jgi:mRNA-degrading endonuclease toxin of MazEF toxin-antitoxin module
MIRGDVLLVRFPQAVGGRGKKRPAVVIQSDSYAGVVSTLVVAGLTSNMHLANDPACLLIKRESDDGRAASLRQDSVLSGLMLQTVHRGDVSDVLGRLAPETMAKFDACLRAALKV